MTGGCSVLHHEWGLPTPPPETCEATEGDEGLVAGLECALPPLEEPPLGRLPEGAIRPQEALP